MRVLWAGFVLGTLLGIFLGLCLGRFPDVVRATGIGFGAGVGIFILGALVRAIAGFTDKAVSDLKDGKKP